MYHRSRTSKYDLRIIFLVAVLFVYWVLTPSYTKENIHGPKSNKLSVGVVVMNRQNAFYLNDAVAALHHDSVVVYNADKNRQYLRRLFKESALVRHIYKENDSFEQPYVVRTDVHKSHKYDKVDVVKTEARKQWWRKENLDFLAMARDLRTNHPAKHYLLIEDDNVFSLDKPIVSVIDESEPLIHMGLGTGALLFCDEFLESFIGYMSLRYDAMPVDWLLEMFMESIGRRLVHKRLFDHVGNVSTKPDQVEGKF